MSQQIFGMGLSTEAISLYLLCCHLEDTLTAISRNNIRELWNGGEEALSEAIGQLESRRVLCRSAPEAGNPEYRLNDPRQWLA